MNNDTIKIEEIDKNFKVESNITEPDIVWLDVKDTPFSIHGVTYDKDDGIFVRMPKSIAENVNTGVAYLYKQTAGGRVRFRTNSPFIAIKVVHHTKVNPASHFTMLGQRGCDIYGDTGNSIEYFGSFRPDSDNLLEVSSSVRTDGQMRDYTINMPLYGSVKEMYIALKKDAIISSPTPYRDVAPILYYGSSITQGGCASKPSGAYQFTICRKTNVDFINLGFAGNAKGEDLMVEYLCSLNPSIFVCDYDHNAPNLEHLRQTHMPLYRAFRKAHPNTPIIFMTAPGNLWTDCGQPYAYDLNYKSRHDLIYNNYLTAKNEGDNNVYFVDGLEFFPLDVRSECTVDGCHPNDLGFSYMAKALLPIIKSILKI